MMGNHANKRAAAARHNAAYVAKAEKPNKRKLITEKVRRFFDDLLDLVESTWHSRAVMRLEWRYFKTKYLWG
ncbi:hypothetical protein [Shewanella algae]|uniref:hypothetical protein n=1 Tax=Shewanella algae TaxID=38313 RepID=UPI001BF0F10C|nr:hypothetical protein [Shewanella algae]BCV40854.1 hypothetical protein TUM17378_21160 [Shewanella algae]